MCVEYELYFYTYMCTLNTFSLYQAKYNIVHMSLDRIPPIKSIRKTRKYFLNFNLTLHCEKPALRFDNTFYIYIYTSIDMI